MSLTSYRAAPPRDAPWGPVFIRSHLAFGGGLRWLGLVGRLPCGTLARALDDRVNGFLSCLVAPASKPGGDLLFHRLSDSTIGAVRFHGRVRDGIGWVTDAMATKLWGRRIWAGLGAKSMVVVSVLASSATLASDSSAVVDGGTLKRE
jgi:hypothetical protein